MSARKESDATILDVDEGSSARESAMVHPADESATLTSAAVMLGAVALIQPELIPGLVMGAGIVLAAKWAPDMLGGVFRPLLKNAVKLGYVAASKASEIAAEATEQVQDVIAEARAESDSGGHTVH